MCLTPCSHHSLPVRFTVGRCQSRTVRQCTCVAVGGTRQVHSAYFRTGNPIPAANNELMRQVCHRCTVTATGAKRQLHPTLAPTFSGTSFCRVHQDSISRRSYPCGKDSDFKGNKPTPEGLICATAEGFRPLVRWYCIVKVVVYGSIILAICFRSVDGEAKRASASELPVYCLILSTI